ncbi:YggT family protein [Novosphingobium sp. FSY-8]|uniref:YggT family protein n=1 Tax=Novosphingobium ovatum TaxID=1908523 RepID=A0ABW9X931_9SPHN|nr:YggT family protein [Novosphingobium ovatum]NBC35037.1 YggT family protein [Novosphingobium ovatum]
MLITLIQIAGYLIDTLRMIVIVQFVFSLLISFNVINTYNQFVAGVWQALNMLLEPFYGPLRRILPDTRPIDFAPMALLVALTIVEIILNNVARSVLS